MPFIQNSYTVPFPRSCLHDIPHVLLHIVTSFEVKRLLGILHATHSFITLMLHFPPLSIVLTSATQLSSWPSLPYVTRITWNVLKAQTDEVVHQGMNAFPVDRTPPHIDRTNQRKIALIGGFIPRRERRASLI